MVDREEGVSYWCAFFITAQNKRQMKKLITITVIIVTMTSCKSTKYHTCDAYKTQYKKLKPEKHRNHHHQLCDAYN